MNNDEQQRSKVSPELHKVCHKLGSGMVIRYGSALFNRSYGDLATFAKAMSVVLQVGGLGESDAQAVSSWLQQGLRPFSEYPPTIEMILNLAYLAKTYPVTERQAALKLGWYALDTEFSQTYFKGWRSEKPIDELTRERVWLSAMDGMMVSEVELREAHSRIRDSGLFRQFPPTLEQFMDAIMAVRNDAPLVEEAWLDASNLQQGPVHPLVSKARGAISSHDLNLHARDRDTENRFKVTYRKLLNGQIELASPVIDEVRQEVVEYESAESLTESIARW